MFTICPKCSYERQASDQAPDWQCPGCGMAYVKTARAVAAGTEAASSGPNLRQPQTIAAPSRPPWGKVAWIAVIAWGVWSGIYVNRFRHGSISSLGANISSNVSAEEIAALAATTKEGDVVIYTLTGCPYCAEAKSWLRQYGFVYSECDAQARQERAVQLTKMGGDGVPYLVVKGKHLSGFDSDEFLDALKSDAGT